MVRRIRRDWRGVLLGVIACGLFVVGSRTRAQQPGENWPQWRGPLGTGASPAADPPTSWAENKNVKWKVRIPGSGNASPIVWGKLVFVQTALPAGEERPAAADARRPAPSPGAQFGAGPAPTRPYQFVLLCLDRETGNTLWQRIVREEIPHEGHHKDHGFSSYSPLTDGKYVWAYFGSRGLQCFDLAGNPKWQKDFGKMQTKLGFGEGSSPALHGDTIVINWDHEGQDFIVALNNETGDELWRTPRDEETTWATPLIVEHGGRAQVVTVATKRVRSYDLASGKQLWEAPGLTANVIPTPVAANGVVYVTSGFRGNVLMAIKLGRTGDLTGTDAILWTHNKATPYVPSPMLSGQRLYFFGGNGGRLSCLDVTTGKPLYESQRVEGLDNVYASPVAAGGKVYLVGRNGTSVVIKDAPKFEVLATNPLDDRIDASPAVAGRELFLRGKEYLYCIAEK
jgi:outer membrane protein assembly factor BamB